jgi:hypothetical protein
MGKSQVLTSNDNSAQPTDRRFGFEADTKCLPMYVKRTLDRLKLKIGRAQWLAITDQERLAIGRVSAEGEADCLGAQELVRGILRRYSTEPVLLPASVERSADPPAEVPAVVTESAREVGFIVDQERWSKLDSDQRYALTKLVDSGKQDKRKRALIEFLGEGDRHNGGS